MRATPSRRDDPLGDRRRGSPLGEFCHSLGSILLSTFPAPFARHALFVTHPSLTLPSWFVHHATLAESTASLTRVISTMTIMTAVARQQVGRVFGAPFGGTSVYTFFLLFPLESCISYRSIFGYIVRESRDWQTPSHMAVRHDHEDASGRRSKG